ncbi:multidrug efflux SMR transporter [Pikeienuella piscinae]|uniref:Guanidinium exporter n=1 Tax=Pikeienuella piscinae TaxID=2748098 RepID=A0A7L5C268_9RHOB|nr:multidrug efflux SMR transporter [Pikeienuella piscinae]QIE56927.1 multidrug efflux SMR transporter [Pikeienuella piscinae]
MGWIYVVVAGFLEVAFTTAMKESAGLTRLWPSILFFITASLSFWFLTRAAITLPISTAYTVWVGIGSVGATLVGILFYGEPAGLARMFFIGLLIASIIGLKLVSE